MGEAEQRRSEASLRPVEEDGSTLADNDILRVQIEMSQRIGHAHFGQAQQRFARKRSQPLQFRRGKRFGRDTLLQSHEPGQARKVGFNRRKKRRNPHVTEREGSQFVRATDRSGLQAAKVARGVDPCPGVPEPRETGSGRLESKPSIPLGDGSNDPRRKGRKETRQPDSRRKFAFVGRSYGLEPDRTAFRLKPDQAELGTGVPLLETAGQTQTEWPERVLDPLSKRREPAGSSKRPAGPAQIERELGAPGA